MKLPGKRIKRTPKRIRAYRANAYSAEGKFRLPQKKKNSIPTLPGIGIRVHKKNRYSVLISKKREKNHDLAHARADIFRFEHERGVTRYLSYFEESIITPRVNRLFGIMPLTRHHTNILDPETFAHYHAKPASFRELKTLIESGKWRLIPFTRNPFYETIRRTLVSNFSTRRQLMRALIHLFRSPEMKPVLDELDLFYNSPDNRQGALLLLKIVDFMEKESQKAIQRERTYELNKGPSN